MNEDFPAFEPDNIPPRAESIEPVNPDPIIPVGIPEVASSTTEYDSLSPSVQKHYDTLAKRMYMFPNSLLRELNELIDTENVTSGAGLQAVVRDRYKGSLKIPGITVFRAYVVIRKKNRALLDKAKKSLEETPSVLLNKTENAPVSPKSIYQDITLSVENKKTLLENLIQLCERRIQAIKVIQETDPSSSYEGVLSGYIKEARAITETLIKLRTELKSEGEKEIETYINGKLSSVIRSTLQAYSMVHGQDKLDLFRATLKAKLRDNKLEELSNS